MNIFQYLHLVEKYVLNLFEKYIPGVLNVVSVKVDVEWLIIPWTFLSSEIPRPAVLAWGTRGASSPCLQLPRLLPPLVPPRARLPRGSSFHGSRRSSYICHGFTQRRGPTDDQLLRAGSCDSAYSERHSSLVILYNGYTDLGLYTLDSEQGQSL